MLVLWIAVNNRRGWRVFNCLWGNIPLACAKGHDYVVIRVACIVHNVSYPEYIHTFTSKDEVATKTLDIYTAGMYAWDSLSIVVVDNNAPTSYNPAVGYPLDFDDPTVSLDNDSKALLSPHHFILQAAQKVHIWGLVVQTPDVPHPFCHIDAQHEPELEAYFKKHAFAYRKNRSWSLLWILSAIFSWQ